MHQNIIKILQLQKDIISKEITDIEEIILFSEKYQTSKDEETEKKLKETIKNLQQKKADIEEQQKSFNEKLQSITEPELKEMAIAYFINGQSCEELAEKYFFDRTTIYKRLKRYFDN